MHYLPNGRAIYIALLLFISPVLIASENNPVVSTNPGDSAVVTKFENVATIAPEKTAADAELSDDKLQPNPGKEKLTIFFAIGLVINIVMMSLFGFWAARQWRKSSNSRGKQ